MAAAGYDVAAGDTWALNELSSAVRQGTGNARANMRAFLDGLYDGRRTPPAARGVVFIAGIGQGTSDLSLYQARLQDWYEDAGLLDRPEPVRERLVAGGLRRRPHTMRSPGSRPRGPARRAERVPAAPGCARRASPPICRGGARTFLAGTYSPLAQRGLAVRRRVRMDRRPRRADAGLRLGPEYALCARPATRGFGFAWSPQEPRACLPPEFAAQTDALLGRLAAAIADSCETPEARVRHGVVHAALLDAAAITAAGAPSPPGSRRGSRSRPRPPTLAPGASSGPLAVELQTATGSHTPQAYR